ncbi:hypothetical protein KM043_006749 [Ampulex compressa]|nr:hypothetical protein KM043_006749 [Ampulex compressa]
MDTRPPSIISFVYPLAFLARATSWLDGSTKEYTQQDVAVGKCIKRAAVDSSKKAPGRLSRHQKNGFEALKKVFEKQKLGSLESAGLGETSNRGKEKARKIS